MGTGSDMGSKRWMLMVRFLMIAIGLLQVIFIGWAKFISAEVLANKTEMASQKSDLAHVKEDVSYIRDRLDTIFEIKRR